MASNRATQAGMMEQRRKGVDTICSIDSRMAARIRGYDHDDHPQPEKEATGFLSSTAQAPGPVARLPPELLVEIFHHVNDAQPALSKDKSSLEPYAGLLHVCSYWRKVALDSPDLWNKVTSNLTPDQLKLYLLHSKALPLHVDYSIESTSDQGSFISNILENMHRVESISMTTKTLTGSTQPQRLWSVPAPHLKTLVIRLTPELALPSSLFANITPSLRCVELYGVRAHWDSITIFQGLTHLNLTRIIPPPSLQWFFAVLRACPDMEDMKLCFNGPRLQHGEIRSSEITLGRLRRFTVISDCNFCAWVARHLCFPSDVKIELMCDNYPFSNPVQLLPTSFVAPRPPHSEPTSRSLILSLKRSVQTNTGRILYKLFLNLATSPDTSPQIKVGLQSWEGFGIVVTAENVADSCISLLKSPLLAAVATCTFRTEYGLRSGMGLTSWRRLLSTLPRLKTLRIFNESTKNALKMEQRIVHVLDVQDGTAIICPLIDCLEFSNVQFSPMFANILGSCLSRRKQRGSPVRALTLIGDLDASDDVVSMLRANVRRLRICNTEATVMHED